MKPTDTASPTVEQPVLRPAENDEPDEQAVKPDARVQPQPVPAFDIDKDVARP